MIIYTVNNSLILDGALRGLCLSEDNVCNDVNTICRDRLCLCVEGYVLSGNSCIQTGMDNSLCVYYRHL